MCYRIAMRNDTPAAALALALAACGAGPQPTGPSVPETPILAPAPPSEAAATPSISCSVAAEGFGEVSASGSTHGEACRRAAEQARARGATRLVRIDGVDPRELVHRTDERPTHTAELDREASCELVVAVRLGEVREGTGESSSEAEAFAIARAEACRALGEEDCSDANGFRAHVTTRAQSFRFDRGRGTTSTTRLRLTLSRVRLIEARSTSRASRGAACRDAYRSACEADTCPEGRRLDSLDGVRLDPPPTDG